MEDTKKKILDKSLELFAAKGYAAVSVRDICTAVGIKESSIYYHYKNKHDILDTLMAEFTGASEAMYTQLYGGLSGMTSIAPQTILAVTDKYYIDYLNNERTKSLISLLAFESSSSDELAGLYGLMLFDWPVRIYTQCFMLLDPETTLGEAQQYATVFYSLIFFHYSRQLIERKSAETVIPGLERELMDLIGSD